MLPDEGLLQKSGKYKTKAFSGKLEICTIGGIMRLKIFSIPN